MAELGPNSTTTSAPRHVRHVIAVAGGRGGVGKSVLGCNLAVYMAQLGKTVVLVDADPAGAELHTLLDVELPVVQPQDPDDDGEPELTTLETPIPGLLLLPQVYTQGTTVPVRPGRKPRWASRLRQLDVDYVILDLGAGTAPATLDLFLGADLGLCVTAPEPPAVETTYRFMRALFQRKIRRTLVKDRFRMRLVDRALSELPPLPAPQDLVRKLGRLDPKLGQLAADELSKLQPRIVVNHARLRTDADLGGAMRDMALRYLGLAVDYIGHIEHDDSVWLSVVRRRPLLIDSPTSKSARHLERIARRVLAVAGTRETAPAGGISMVATEPNFYELLWTHRGATDEEIRRAYKRVREHYQPRSLPLTSLLTEAALVQEQARIDEAYDTLLDPVRRRAYDLSTFPEAEEDEPVRDVLVDTALAAERAMLRQELAREITAETDFTGPLLCKVREAQGIELEEIAQTTKISISHLRAIETEDFRNLPAVVYTRGFVQQVAKHLQLDPSQVARTYLRRMRQWRHASGD